MIKAALYLRVSSDIQAKEGDSIPAQRDALRKYAKEHGMIVAGEYVDDGISGTKYSQRDELQRMLSDVEAGKIDIIIFTKLDRFFRSVRHYTATKPSLMRIMSAGLPSGSQSMTRLRPRDGLLSIR